MGEGQSGGTARAKYRGSFGWLRRVDDAVYAAEQAIVVTFLIAMTVMVFLDVVYRRLSSQDSKVGQLVAKVFGIEDAGTRAFIDQTLAPWMGLVLGVLLLWFAFWTAQRRSDRPLLPIKRAPIVLALVTAVALGVLGWMMLTLPSRIVYLVLYGLATVGYTLGVLRSKPPGWQRRLGVLWVVVTPIFVYFALVWFPRGYTWSKEMSLQLLLWVGFLGASICAHEGKHLRMEAFEKIIPPKMVRWVQIAGFTFTALFSGFLALLGYQYVFAPGTGAFYLGGVFEQTQLPDWIATVAVPFAFGLTMLRFFAAAISAATGGSYGQSGSDELAEAEKAKAEMLGAPVHEETEATRAAEEESTDEPSTEAGAEAEDDEKERDQ